MISRPTPSPQTSRPRPKLLLPIPLKTKTTCKRSRGTWRPRLRPEDNNTGLGWVWVGIKYICSPLVPTWILRHQNVAVTFCPKGQVCRAVKLATVNYTVASPVISWMITFALSGMQISLTTLYSHGQNSADKHCNFQITCKHITCMGTVWVLPYYAGTVTKQLARKAYSSNFRKLSSQRPVFMLLLFYFY